MRPKPVRRMIMALLFLPVVFAACSGEYSKEDGSVDVPGDDAVVDDTAAEDTAGDPDADVPDDTPGDTPDAPDTADTPDTSDTADTPPPDTPDTVEEEIVDPCADHCSNDALDCGETGVDCGGGGCPTCDDPTMSFGLAYQTPNIAVFASDRIMIVWAGDSPNRIFFACYDGDAWSDNTLVGVSDRASEYPRLAADSTGTFHLAYVDDGGPGSRIRYAKYAGDGCGGSWEDGGNIDTEDYTPSVDFRSGWPNIDVDENDYPWVTWTEDDFTRIHVTRWTGEAWTEPVDLAETPGTDYSAVGDIALSGTTASVVWLEGHSGYGTARRLRYREGDGSAWSDHLDLENSGYMKNPQMDADDDGNVYVLSLQGGANVQFKAKIDGTWQEDWTELGGSPGNNWGTIKIDDSGGMHGAWMQHDGASLMQIYYATGSAADGTWNDERQVSFGANPTFDPFIGVDEEGYAHIIWIDDTPPLADDTGTVTYVKVRYEDL